MSEPIRKPTILDRIAIWWENHWWPARIRNLQQEVTDYRRILDQRTQRVEWAKRVLNGEVVVAARAREDDE